MRPGYGVSGGSLSREPMAMRDGFLMSLRSTRARTVVPNRAAIPLERRRA